MRFLYLLMKKAMIDKYCATDSMPNLIEEGRLFSQLVRKKILSHEFDIFNNHMPQVYI
jgi:hypothetical protein